jgi:hypothetical protein
MLHNQPLIMIYFYLHSDPVAYTYGMLPFFPFGLSQPEVAIRLSTYQFSVPIAVYPTPSFDALHLRGCG